MKTKVIEGHSITIEKDSISHAAKQNEPFFRFWTEEKFLALRAGDAEEAWDIVEEEIKENGLEHFSEKD